MCNNAKKIHEINKKNSSNSLETTENKPDQFKINNVHQQLQDIENYKITESIICSKEKIKLEQTNKFFFDQKNQKQKQKTIN